MSICYPYVIPTASVSYDAATTAWINAVVAAGGTVSDTQKSRVDALIVGLKADSLFSANSRLWIHAGESVSQQATIDIMGLATATPQSSPAFGAGGYTGDGSADHVNLGTLPSNFVRDSNSYGAYNLKDSTTINNDVLIGFFDTTSGSSDIFPQQSSGNALGREGNATIAGTAANRKGFLVFSRTGANTSEFYRNGSSIGTDGGSSTAVPATSFFILARNDNGSPSSFGIDIAAASWIGPGLDDTQAANLSTRINTYMTAWSVNVY